VGYTQAPLLQNPARLIQDFKQLIVSKMLQDVDHENRIHRSGIRFPQLNQQIAASCAGDSQTPGQIDLFGRNIHTRDICVAGGPQVIKIRAGAACQVHDSG
jgi:hypothetical protein